MLNINEPKAQRGITLLQLGFRPFFLGAAFFSVISMALWMGIYSFGWEMRLLGMTATLWHAHEMLFGYLLAVIAGFLLTAIKNWTGQHTLRGPKLLLLFAIWATARLLAIFNLGSIELMALLDGLFLTGLAIAAAIPIIRIKQWAQLGILLLLALMLSANMVFYAGIMGLVENGALIGIYSGLYLILMLVFVMARRVVPFFIERGAGLTTSLTNRKWLDNSCLVLFATLWFTDVLLVEVMLSTIIAAVLFLLHAIRLFDWHTPKLWREPMVWVLYLAYSFLVLGFALKTATTVFGISPFLSVHAFTFGGIGVLTLGMMTRVTLGHTGRNVLEPPRFTTTAFVLMLIGAMVRIMFPLLMPAEYALWVALSQLCWIAAFGIFLLQFLPILVAPRIDGQPG